MVMMIIGMVTLTSCEKEDVFDGKKPTDQVLGGGDEIGNPEDFYPYTDKIIVEHDIEFFGDEYGNLSILTTEINKNIKKYKEYIIDNKKIIRDTLTLGDSQTFELKTTNYEGYIIVKTSLVFFKNDEIKRYYLVEHNKATYDKRVFFQYGKNWIDYMYNNL